MFYITFDFYFCELYFVFFINILCVDRCIFFVLLSLFVCCVLCSSIFGYILSVLLIIGISLMGSFIFWEFLFLFLMVFVVVWFVASVVWFFCFLHILFNTIVSLFGVFLHLYYCFMIAFATNWHAHTHAHAHAHAHAHTHAHAHAHTHAQK